MKRYLISMIFVLISSPAFSGQTSGWGKITALYIDADSTFVRLSFSQAIVNPDSCSASQWYIKEVSGGNSFFISEILAAFHSQKDVRFWISGCTTGSYWGGTQPQLSDIEVSP